MEQVFVLPTDWNSAKDPVPYYGKPPETCLDFNNRRGKPRALLVATGVATYSDCEYGLPYDVVVCDVQSQDLQA